MIMGGEVYLGNATTDKSWTIGRHLGLQIAAHILSPFGIRPILDRSPPEPAAMATSASDRTTCSST